MKHENSKIKIVISVLLSVISSLAFATIDHKFNKIKTDPNALYTFFKEMPKGGELHYHLAGGAYPEFMLKIASKNNLCLDKNQLAITDIKENCEKLNESLFAMQPTLYDQIIRAWSMKNFIPGVESGHDHFFASFYKFLPIINHFSANLLTEIMQRAADQHELYLEIMIVENNVSSTTFDKFIHDTNELHEKKERLLSNNAFQDNIKQTVQMSRQLLQQARQELGCDKHPEQPVCKLTIKFQYYILREQSIDKVFAQALNGFAAAAQSNDIVGINLVQAEDGIISLRDYRQQMQILKFLHAAYPTVQIALHAGELAPRDVTPENLRFHIHDAIFTGQAKRIGHGASIAYEDNANQLLDYMAKTPIPVEINLTSNREILSISGKQHPFAYYLSHHVPIVLSTDDEGILRTDLTRQYVEATMAYQLDYSTIKTINRNALTYSFLPGKSLWANPQRALPVAACKSLDSQTCHQFINANQKAQLQWQLEKQLTAFEKNNAG